MSNENVIDDNGADPYEPLPKELYVAWSESDKQEDRYLQTDPDKLAAAESFDNAEREVGVYKLVRTVSLSVKKKVTVREAKPKSK